MPSSLPNSTPSPPVVGQRIAKVMARAGVCSRREAERWILKGRVSVNGEVLNSPARTVNDADEILVDGKPLPAAPRTRLWRYYKPSGLVVTERDEKGRPTIFEALPKNMPRVMSVGRLDLNSEGLLLLTNDGAAARQLELPTSGWLRRYRVRVHGQVEAARLETLKCGVTVEGIRYGSVEATVERQQGSNAWLAVRLREGKNREIRRIMDHLGYPVNRLIRTGYGPFTLDGLNRGEVAEIPPGDMRRVLDKPHKGAKAKTRKPYRGRSKVTDRPSSPINRRKRG